MHLSAKPSPKRVIPTSPLGDYQVDRPAVQAWRHVELTGTNRTIDLTTFLHAASVFRRVGNPDASWRVRCREQGRLGPCGPRLCGSPFFQFEFRNARRRCTRGEIRSRRHSRCPWGPGHTRSHSEHGRQASRANGSASSARVGYRRVFLKGSGFTP